MLPWTRITCLPLTQDLRLLLDRIVKDQHSRLPIYEGFARPRGGHSSTPRTCCGVVSERLEERRAATGAHGFAPHTPPTHDRPRCQASQPGYRRGGAETSFSLGLVVDEFGTYVGLVTVEDVLEQLVAKSVTSTIRTSKPSTRSAATYS